MDVKSAFLQGDQISRDIFINPPSEASVLNGVLWKLRKVVYGLNDASRNWFFTVRKELLSSHCIQSTIDKAIFRWYDNSKLAGLFVLHVDDFLYAGTKSFITNVIDKICLKFQIGSQGTNCFKYWLRDNT